MFCYHQLPNRRAKGQLKPQHVRPGFAPLTPYLIAQSAESLIEWLERVFNAEVFQLEREKGGLVQNAAIRIGEGMVEVAEAVDPWPASPAAVHLYVPDVDTAYQRAAEAGAESLFEFTDQDYGERSAGFKGRWGNQWFPATYLAG